MRKVKVEDAVGESLAHDIIKYGPGVKTVLFEREHEIERKDIDKLKDAGNYFVYVTNGEGKSVHEDEAALRMAEAAMGENLRVTKPQKGRVRVVCKTPGLFKAKVEKIKEVNLQEDFVFASSKNNTGIFEGTEVASVKIVPLAIEENKMKKVESILKEKEPALKVISPQIDKIGLIITGTEVHEGRIEDAFEERLEEKFNRYNLSIQETTILPDDREKIRKKILEYREKDYDLILVTGGMAVDSEDITAEAIRGTGAEVVPRGTPVFPGNMLMLARLEDSSILGVPACVLPDDRTSFDVILPRVLAGEKLTKEDIAELAEGGLLSQ